MTCQKIDRRLEIRWRRTHVYRDDLGTKCSSCVVEVFCGQKNQFYFCVELEIQMGRLDFRLAQSVIAQTTLGFQNINGPGVSYGHPQIQAQIRQLQHVPSDSLTRPGGLSSIRNHDVSYVRSAQSLFLYGGGLQEWRVIN